MYHFYLQNIHADPTFTRKQKKVLKRSTTGHMNPHRKKPNPQKQLNEMHFNTQTRELGEILIINPKRMKHKYMENMYIGVEARNPSTDFQAHTRSGTSRTIIRLIEKLSIVPHRFGRGIILDF
ncbi:hypothetical protein CRM22_008483 [Opisthorchis felineus]|uniref:Uncharacterized protein n=1 Tax=Opisthorchis felineus TaxID=147828 RepID=A0A4S2LJA2_OPIFE|nr:hypothetical protein CRM22_008483 [Opisthorchis felineus]